MNFCFAQAKININSNKALKDLGFTFSLFINSYFH